MYFEIIGMYNRSSEARFGVERYVGRPPGSSREFGDLGREKIESLDMGL